MTLHKKAEEVAREIYDIACGTNINLDEDLKVKKYIATALQRFAEAQIAEEHINIAVKQALILGDSTMLNGKIIANEELYKQPVDYIREARNQALDEAAGIADEKIDRYHDDGSTIADRIRALKSEVK